MVETRVVAFILRDKANPSNAVLQVTTAERVGFNLTIREPIRLTAKIAMRSPELVIGYSTPKYQKGVLTMATAIIARQDIPNTVNIGDTVTFEPGQLFSLNTI